MNRETIYSNLFALVSAAPGLVTTSRNLKHWNDVGPSEMPALFQAQGAQVAMPVTGHPTRWELNATLWVYVSTIGADPGPVLNPILDAIANALDRTAVTAQTLGGLAHYARIEGSVETSEGTLGDVEVVRIPVKILVH